MMPSMRTTVTLDPDVDALVKQRMRERGVTFKQALNEAVRAGAGGGRPRRRASFPTFDLGEPLIDVTKALRLSGLLEDQELTARLARGA